MSRLRVLHVITQMVAGGAQENTLATVEGLDRARFEVDLAHGPQVGPEGDLFERARRAADRLFVVDPLVREVHPLRDLAAFREISRIVRAGRYAVVHTHCSKAGILGRWAARRAGVPAVVHSSHSHVFYGYFSRPVTEVFKVVERWTARRTDVLIELTETGVREHLEHGVGRPDQFMVAHSGVDLAPFRAWKGDRARVRAALGLAPDAVVVGSLARLVPVKGLDVLVEAMPAVLARAPAARLLLVGDGPERAALAARALALGVAGRVTFAGHRDDVADCLAAMDLFCLPSRNEGQGRAIVQASAMGLAVVGTCVGGVPEVVLDGRTGLLVPPGDPALLAEAVARLAADPDARARMGREGRLHVDPEFGQEEMLKKIEAAYSRALGGG